MELKEAICDELDLIDLSDKVEKTNRREKHDEIMNTNLSLLRMFVSACQSNNYALKIKPRQNNNFYCRCVFHNTFDLSMRIVDSKKAFYCYGCGEGGTIVTFVSVFFGISIEESIDLLYNFITNNLASLNKEELKILDELFKYYDSPVADTLFLESQEKGEMLGERIKNYIETHNCQEGSEDQIADRLCCSKVYVNQFLPKSNNI